jgi:hypothetical protein
VDQSGEVKSSLEIDQNLFHEELEALKEEMRYSPPLTPIKVVLIDLINASMVKRERLKLEEEDSYSR